MLQFLNSFSAAFGFGRFARFGQPFFNLHRCPSSLFSLGHSAGNLQRYKPDYFFASVMTSRTRSLKWLAKFSDASLFAFNVALTSCKSLPFFALPQAVPVSFCTHGCVNFDRLGR